MTRMMLGVLVLVSATVGVGIWSCGAENAVALPPERPAQLETCRQEVDLLNQLLDSLRAPKMEGLRQVIQQQFTTAEYEERTAPLNILLRTLVRMLGDFAEEPPEKGAVAQTLCATPPPPLEQSNHLCELRRTARSLFDEGKAQSLLKRLNPLLVGIMKYIVGQNPSSAVSHYEIAEVLHGMCSTNSSCQMSNTLELLSAFLEFSRTSEGKDALAHISQLFKNPALQPFLKDDGQQYGGEAGIVALVEVLVTSVKGMQTPEDLDALPIDQLPEELRPDLELALGHIKSMLAPGRTPNILRPLKKALVCLSSEDSNLDLVRMVYRLGLEQALPEFGVEALAETLSSVSQIDTRGSTLVLAKLAIDRIRADEAATDALSNMCRTFTSIQPENGQSISNAQAFFPALTELLSEDILGSLLCVVEPLLAGCTGGQAPLTCSVP